MHLPVDSIGKKELRNYKNDYTMKKIATLLAVLAAGYSAQAADATVSASKPAYTVTTDFTYASEYVFRGQKQSNAAFQASAEVGYKAIYAGVWANQPLRNGEGDEIDFYLGYGFPLQNDWKIDTGLSSYSFPEFIKGSGSSRIATYEGYVGLTGGNFGGFTPSLYTYYDFKYDDVTVQGSIGYSLPIKQIGTSLDFAVTYGFSPNTGRFNSGVANNTYWGAGVTVPYQLAANTKITGGLQYADADGANATQAGFAVKSTFYYTIGLTFGF